MIIRNAVGDVVDELNDNDILPEGWSHSTGGVRIRNEGSVVSINVERPGDTNVHLEIYREPDARLDIEGWGGTTHILGEKERIDQRSWTRGYAKGYANAREEADRDAGREPTKWSSVHADVREALKAASEECAYGCPGCMCRMCADPDSERRANESHLWVEQEV